VELTTVADDFAVFHTPGQVERVDGLPPGSLQERHGHLFSTLPRPGGELLCRFATVNDVHFGETECGVLGGFEGGPILSVPEGSTPYPIVMNRGAIAEIAAIDPAAVIVKGDLTADGTDDEYQSFLDHYVAAFGDGLFHVRGNHDAYRGQTYAAGWLSIQLPGVIIALLDTARPHHANGTVSDEQLEWLDTLAAESDRPVLVMGHHHVWSPDSTRRSETYFGIVPDDSEKLVDVVARRSRICGYFAGHTHRNRVRRIRATGSVPWVEVACVKDFPGSWAEYRVYEGGVLQIHHRISAPDALAWSDQCRGLYADIGLDYVEYALGKLEDRCFPISIR
jgi:predicted phosphodiesterase